MSIERRKTTVQQVQGICLCSKERDVFEFYYEDK